VDHARPESVTRVPYSSYDHPKVPDVPNVGSLSDEAKPSSATRLSSDTIWSGPARACGSSTSRRSIVTSLVLLNVSVPSHRTPRDASSTTSAWGVR